MLIACALQFTACAVYRPLPQPTIVNFSIEPIDPPVQSDKERDCVAFGYDGLACRDDGIGI